MGSGHMPAPAEELLPPHREAIIMRLPEWTKPAIWGAVAGGVVTVVVGFSYMGWSTAGSADRMAQVRADTAVVAALVPFCAAKAQQDTDLGKLVKFHAETSSYSRSDIVRAAGWATLPGMTAPDYALSQACSDRLQTASLN
jgi:hypothetical protein